MMLTCDEAAKNHRHLRNIDCLTVSTACLVCFISAVNGHSKKERKEAYYEWRYKQAHNKTLTVYIT